MCRDEIAVKNRVDKRLEQEAVLNKANHFAASSSLKESYADSIKLKLTDQNDNQIACEELLVMFQLIDLNGDDKISSMEIRKLLHVLGFEKDHDESPQINLFGKIFEGEVDFKTFFTAMNNCSKMKTQSKERALRAFEYFDKEKNGGIHGEDLAMVLQSYKGKWSKETANSIMRNAGLSTTKQIDYRDFVSTIFFCLGL